VTINDKVVLVGSVVLAGLSLILSAYFADKLDDDWAGNFLFFALVIVVLFFVFGLLGKEKRTK